MCQREYLISRIFRLLLVLLKRAYFPRIAVSHKVFQNLSQNSIFEARTSLQKRRTDPNKESNQQ